MLNKALIDSGHLVALFDKDDIYHKQAKAFLKEFKGKLLSTTAVLTEVCHLLDFSVQAQIDFLTWVKNGAVQLEEITSFDLSRVIELTKKYADIPMDFADSTLVVIGERLNISQIASVDKDFYIYRFRRRQAFFNIFFG